MDDPPVNSRHTPRDHPNRRSGNSAHVVSPAALAARGVIPSIRSESLGPGTPRTANIHIQIQPPTDPAMSKAPSIVASRQEGSVRSPSPLPRDTGPLLRHSPKKVCRLIALICHVRTGLIFFPHPPSPHVPFALGIGLSLPPASRTQPRPCLTVRGSTIISNDQLPRLHLETR